MDAPTQDGRPIQLLGPLAKDRLLLQSFSGQEGISIPFHYDLLLLSMDDAIRFDDVVGRAATVRIELPGNQERFLNGILSSFTLTDKSPHDFVRYQATLVPKLWMLTRNADCRIFQDQSVPDILEAILGENGVLFSNRLTAGRSSKRPYCVQYSETDFHFISRLMEDEGIFYFFEHTQENGHFQHAMVLADSPIRFQGVPLLEPGLPNGRQPKAEFRSRESTEQGGQSINSWNVAQEVRPDMYELRDFNFEQPTLDLTARSQTGNDASREIYEFPGGYTDRDRGRMLVDVRMEEIETANTVISASSNYLAFLSGFRFDLSSHFRQDFNDKSYLLTSIFHCFKQGNVFFGTDEGGRGSLQYANTFQAVPHPTRFRPPRTTKVPVIPSTQTAIVVGANTAPPVGPPPPPPATIDDIYTDKFGRVKVRFHWDRTARNGDTTAFIRVAQPWAGRGWGHQWIPRIGNEVVVTFLEGDPDRPLITGSVYNGDNPLPFGIPDCRTQSGIRTHSTPVAADSTDDRFNMLRFDDKREREQVFLRSQRRMDFRALGSFYETNGGDRHALIGWKDDKSQGGDFDITVGNDVNFHIQGGCFERVEKKLNTTVVADVVYDFEANHSTMVGTKSELNAKQVIIEAKEKISLKVGGSFILIEPGGVTIYGASVKINSGGFGVETGDPDIEDPLDAMGADTGKPCSRLYTAASGGSRTRQHRRLHSQHAPSTPRPGEDPRMTAIRNALQNSAAGRHALEAYDQYGMNTVFRTGSGGFYDAPSTMVLDTNDGNSNTLWFVHEMYHAQRDHEGTAPQSSDPDRAHYVDSRLQEESHGDALASQAAQELNDSGNNTVNSGMVSNSYQGAYQRGRNDYQSTHPDATPDELDAAGRTAGEQQILDDYRSGRTTTSLPPPNNVPYPTYYGNDWDRAHPPPAPAGGGTP